MLGMGEKIFGNRLLLVDDEPAFGRLVKGIAQDCGFEVVITDDPRRFTKTARSWNPTVIVMDLKMPGIDGIQLLRALAADQCVAHVIIASGSDQKVLDSAMQLGHERGLKMSGLLPKPVRLEILREMLSNFKKLPKDLLTRDLAGAIASHHLFLEYQPKFDCRAKQYTGVEALVRWRHPEHGIILPDAFIAIAEETDLIHRLTDWVFISAGKQAVKWHAHNLFLEVSVNISARDIEDLDLPERLDQHCTDVGIKPETMILEVTETGAMRQAVQVMDVLTRLRLKGFKLSIDDFGTGYSSLVQLQRLPFSEIKIDSSFVMNLMENSGCRVIAEIIVELAKRLGLKSVAEGVEDEPTLNSLMAMGCDTVQGYYLSRPIAPDLLESLVRAHRTRNVPAVT
jgi:EAL domain-containing protein (putative c-di-GMP-specific phosphodiesterase class I)/AmiR/NasT family two-component response regulator